MRAKAFLYFSSTALLCLSLASVAQAQATRTWVSGVGDDVNPCSRTAPCKTFAGAISKTAAGGEIDALDPGGYGAVTIVKAITIDGGAGHVASILASNVNGVVINAGTSDVVTLRNLSINGALGGLIGVRFLAGKQLNMEHVTVSNFTGSPGRGVTVEGSGAVTMALTMQDVIIRNNTNAGLAIVPLSGTPAVTADLMNVYIRSEGPLGDGIFAGEGTKMTVRNSVVTQNGQAGLDAGGVTAPAVVNVENSQFTSNSIGVRTGGTSTIRLSQCMITGNTANGLVIGAGSTINTWGNNRIFGNVGNNGAGVTTVGGLQ